ncbi:MAG: hypothetical protein KDB03_15410 [Planctomycetales bacterium]|nr:hypothetical protein [Planctomycetales bacterium]
MSRSDVHSEFSKRKGKMPKRRVVRWLSILAGCLAIAVAVTPTLLSYAPGFVTSAINRFSGVTPLRIELDSLSVGWLSPVRLSGLRLIDDQLQPVVSIRSIETQKALLGWITSSSQLGTLRIEGLETAIEVHDGTTNLEENLATIIAQNLDTPEPTDTTSAPPPTGRIELVDSKILFTARGQLEKWVVQIEKANTSLPKPGEVVGPTELHIKLGDATGTVPGVGTIIATVQSNVDGQGLDVHSTLSQVPLAFWQALRGRLPGIPVEALSGDLSANMTGRLLGIENWRLNLESFQVDQVSVLAPTLLGNEPAVLSTLQSSGQFELTSTSLQIRGAKLNCDFAAAGADIQLPWPIELPSLTTPHIPNGRITAAGVVDLPKLVVAARTLVPMRENVSLQDGKAQFQVTQDVQENGNTNVRARVEFADLKANNLGQTLVWGDPFIVEASATSDSSEHAQFGLACKSEFCEIQGRGSLQTGQLVGKLDLELLQRKLSQWVDLPISNMNGSASLNTTWKLAASNLFEAQGNFYTTPLRITSDTGGSIQEPAWAGEFSGQAIMENGSPQQLNKASLRLKATNEQLAVTISEPLILTGDSAAISRVGQPASPAGFTLNLVGDLADWQRRATMFLTAPLETQIGGQMELAVSGRLDLAHAEILQANWNSKPLSVSSPSFTFHEPMMVGNFKGRVDTNDLAKLAIEKMDVRGASFSLSASDAVSDQDPSTRKGEAIFLVDFKQLLNNMRPQAVGGVQPASVTPENTITANGQMQGQLHWAINPEQAEFTMRSDARDVYVYSQPIGSLAPSPLWNEPQLQSNVHGVYRISDGQLALDSAQLLMPWMNCLTAISYTPSQTLQEVSVNGQAVYDCQSLAEKLRPWTGGQLQLQGQQTVPIKVNWQSSTDPATSLLAGLQAETRIGWEEAQVVGIHVGKADVPIQISEGQLSTNTEIPVSGGTLRWDLTSDLTAPAVVISQKPMKVLENVEITPQMCQSWLKYVTPLLADATSVDGRLSLQLDKAELNPSNPRNQTVVGQLVMHNAEVGPGPLYNEIITLVHQLDAIRKQDLTQAVSNQRVWVQMPEQRIDFQMHNGQVVHRNLNIRAGDATITSTGTVDIDGRMELLAVMPLPNDWIDKSPWLAGLRGQSLQFPVHGSITSPKIDSNALRQLGRQTMQNAAQGILQQGLSRGLEKLLGNPPPTPTGNK